MENATYDVVGVGSVGENIAESGDLTLDDEVARRVPLAPPGVIIRELPGHSGGPPDYAMTPAYLDAVATRPFAGFGY